MERVSEIRKERVVEKVKSLTDRARQTYKEEQI